MSLEHLAAVELVAFDVDGVFTDGRLYFSNSGSETKAFHTHDGYGVRRLLAAGVAVAVISGRSSSAVERRMRELGVNHVIQGCRDKVAALDGLCESLGLTPRQCAYVGDDIPDLPVLRHVGTSIAVANAVEAVRAECDYQTAARGGFGAVREVCDLVLEARGPST